MLKGICWKTVSIAVVIVLSILAIARLIKGSPLEHYQSVADPYKVCSSKPGGVGPDFNVECLHSENNPYIQKGWLKLLLQKDGHLLVIHSPEHIKDPYRYRPDDIIWKSGTYVDPKRGPFRLVVQSDGNLVIYAHPSKDLNPIWSSGTGGKKNGPFSLFLYGHRMYRPSPKIFMRDNSNNPIWGDPMSEQELDNTLKRYKAELEVEDREEERKGKEFSSTLLSMFKK